MTLVTGNFNRGVSNLGWGDKKPEFGQQKSLVINYAVAQTDDWSERTIAERAKVLAPNADFVEKNALSLASKSSSTIAQVQVSSAR